MQTVADLIEMLEDLPPTAEIRAAVQPGYPMSAQIAGVSQSDGVAYVVVEHQDEYLDGDAMWRDARHGY